MAATGGETVQPLMRRLEEEPQAFSFFRALWLLEQAQPDAVRVGMTGPARDETVRLRPAGSLDFPTADVRRIERRESSPAFSLISPILGLYGVTSPLPSFYTTDILHREMREGEDEARVLFDVMNHRLMSLLYRAWLKYRWEFAFEPGAVDRTSQFLMGWLGLATEGLQDRVGVPAGRLLRYAGAITQRPRNASSVAGVVSDYFGEIPVVVQQCVSRWVRLEVSDQNRIGAMNSTLGGDITIGERVLDRMGKCRLRIGPLELNDWERLRPGGPEFGRLCALMRYLMPDFLLFDFELVLARESVPRLQLNGAGDSAKLGWSSWALSDAADADKHVVFHAAPARRAA